MSENETRTELFSALQSLSEIATEMRAGQLMAAVGELCSDIHGRGLWDASDAELLEAVWQFRRSFEASVWRSKNSIAIGQRDFAEENCGWRLKVEAGAGSVVE